MFSKLFRAETAIEPTIIYRWLGEEITYKPSPTDLSYIKSFLERTESGRTIERISYSQLLLGNLTESSTNQEVIAHLISIMKQLIEISIIHTEYAYLPQLNVLKDFERSDELQQAICAIIQYKYYVALNHVNEYLLRCKNEDEPLDFIEIHLVYIFINCILSNKL